MYAAALARPPFIPEGTFNLAEGMLNTACAGGVQAAFGLLAQLLNSDEGICGGQRVSRPQVGAGAHGGALRRTAQDGRARDARVRAHRALQPR